MLTIQNIVDPSINLIAPTVFVESVERISSGSYRILYSLQDTCRDGKFSWFDDSQIISDLYINLSLDQESSSIPLLFIKKSYQHIKNSKLENNKTYFFFGEQILNSTSSNVYVTASCGNEFLSGVSTIEPVLLSGSIATSSYASSSFEYINKIKDLSLLKTNYSISASNFGNSAISSELFVSYTTNKNTLLGFVFDLERYLEDNSTTYKRLSSYKNYSTEILQNSSVIADSVRFFKLNKTIKNSSEQPISSPVSIIKLSQAGQKYLITTAFKENSKYEYSATVSLAVDDYADKIINNKLLNDLESLLSTLKAYRDLFEEFSKNIEINAQEYIFTNYWDKISQEISPLIESVSEITAFYNGEESYEQTKKYVSLLSSIVHPLTSRTELVSAFIDHVNTLISRTRKFLEDTQLYNVSNLNNSKEYKNIYEKTFKEEIDLNYEEGYGFEVISADSYNIRKDEMDTGLRELPIAELDLRKLLEANKYLANPSQATRQNINSFSISTFDLGKNNYNTLTDIHTTNTTIFNEIFYKLNELSGFNFHYPKAESEYFQLSGDGITITTIANAANTSVNNLQKSVLFDQNQDSKVNSSQFIVDTGIDLLYLSLDQNKFSALPSGSFHYSVLTTSSLNEGPKFVVSSASLSNPELKSKSIIYYNTIYKNKLLYGGQSFNIDIYKLENESVSSLIQDNLKIFNQYYYVRKQNSLGQSAPQQFNLASEINANIPQKYLNRNTQKQKFLIGIESI